MIQVTLWPIPPDCNPQQLKQAIVDGLVEATLRRSGLIPGATLKRQQRDEGKERFVTELFEDLTEELT
jgi:hypothetical protein